MHKVWENGRYEEVEGNNPEMNLHNGGGEKRDNANHQHILMTDQLQRMKEKEE